MIENYLLWGIGIAFGVMLLVMLGQRIRIAYPIFLTVAGLLISFIPGIPTFQVDPSIVFLIFLPPILFEAAWNTSWKDFLRFRRPILGLAFGLVFLTSIVVAYLSSNMIPGITVAMGFLLGGINSPPDAVAATSILKHLKIPKRTLSILEGESLINDASSLIVMKFALAAILTGQFVMQKAIGNFFVMAIMGALVGLVIAFLLMLIFRILPTTSDIDTIFTLITPYIMYIVAEHFHYSGVLAVVTGGLVMSYNSNRFQTHTTRIQAVNVWSTIIFLMNAFIFILIGLQMPAIIDEMSPEAIKSGLGYAVIIGGAIVLTRFVWTFTWTYLPPLLFKSIRKKDKHLDWREPFILSLAAMRGVVSLAGALAIPLALPSGEAFPHRDMIIFVTFIIILLTLVGQGLLLPIILKYIDIKEVGATMSEEEQETRILWKLKRIALHTLDKNYSEEVKKYSLVNNRKMQLQADLELLENRLKCINNSFHGDAVKSVTEIRREIIKEQRKLLSELRRMDEFDDSVLRKQELSLDLDEAKITGFQH
ncbi:Na+/H+ antiporter [Elizabethkingia anophelis]|uniref:Na+/H+ antiporter n=1 Tax=Elizabethkingia anophelis TaxID=1117645 RepID=UPI00378708AE